MSTYYLFSAGAAGAVSAVQPGPGRAGGRGHAAPLPQDVPQPLHAGGHAAAAPRPARTQAQLHGAGGGGGSGQGAGQGAAQGRGLPGEPDPAVLPHPLLHGLLRPLLLLRGGGGPGGGAPQTCDPGDTKTGGVVLDMLCTYTYIIVVIVAKHCVLLLYL